MRRRPKPRRAASDRGARRAKRRCAAVEAPVVEAPALNEEFRHRLRVRYGECDPQGVVFNAHYLAYFDIALTELWRDLGGYEAMVSDGVDMVVAEARIRYLAPLRFDDEADLVVAAVRLGTTSMTSELVIERRGETVAEGELRHVFVDPAAGAKAPIPDTIRAGLERYAPATQPGAA